MTGEGATRGALPLAVATGTVVRLIGRSINTLCALTSLGLLSHYLNASDFGAVIAATAALALATSWADAGVVSTAVREVAAGRLPLEVAAARAVGARLVVAVIVAVAMIPATAVLFSGDGKQEIRLGVWILVAGLIPAALASGYQTHAEALIKPARMAVADAACRVVGLGALVAVVAWGMGLHAVFIAVLAPALLLPLCLRLTYSHGAYVRPRFDAGTRRLLHTSVPLGLALIINSIYFRIDAVLLGVLRSTDEVGAYGLAYRLLEMVLMPGALFLTALLPALASAEDRAQWVARARRAVQIMASAGVAATLATVLLAPEMVRLVSGSREAGAVTLLRILSLSALLSWVNGCLGTMVISMNRQNEALWLNLLAMVFNLTACLIVIPRFGATGAAWVTVISEVVILIGSMSLVRRYSGTHLQTQAGVGRVPGVLLGPELGNS